jgi:hypothetical protein
MRLKGAKLGKASALFVSITLGWKSLSGANAQAYFASLSVWKKEASNTDSYCQRYLTYFRATYAEPRRFVPGKLFQANLIFVGRVNMSNLWYPAQELGS